MPEKQFTADGRARRDTGRRRRFGRAHRTADRTLPRADVHPIVHVWQEDTGFRVGSIRNKAIARATGAYIIQVDGDVILHPDFVRDHVSVARPGRFVSGSRVLLGPRYSAGLLANRSIDINAWKRMSPTG